MDSNYVAFQADDYTQSANTLFHFMKEPDFLNRIILQRAIKPRYCIEDIGYLDIHTGKTVWKQIAVLQKCFCDIPFHKLAQNFSIEGEGEEFDALGAEDKFIVTQKNTHPDFYGGYAIAFSKSWGEEKKLQPVHYLNESSNFAMDYSRIFNNLLTQDDVPDDYVDDILNRITYMKPLRGSMNRRYLKKIEKTDKDGNKTISQEQVTISVKKNFHDEQEWRYIPDISELEKIGMDSVIANPYVVKIGDSIDEMNKKIEKEECKTLWIDFKYEDIRYIIVPTLQDRIDMINVIRSIDVHKFENPDTIEEQKYILISKILVFEEIRKDL